MSSVVYAVAIGLKAISTYQTGQMTKKKMYLEAQQEEIKGQRENLIWQQKGNEALEALTATNAAVTARASAGGVSPFSGSAMLVSGINELRGGKSQVRAIESGHMAESLAETQAGILRSTGDYAAQSATISAITTVFAAGAQAYALGSAPTDVTGSTATQTAAASAASPSLMDSLYSGLQTMGRGVERSIRSGSGLLMLGTP